MFSILIVSAGRLAALGSGAGAPVSGKGGGAVVVVVDSLVVVPWGSAFFLVPPPPQAAATRAATRTHRTSRRGTASELLERGDALVEGRVGVEQAVHPRQPPLARPAGERRLDPQVGGGARRGVHDRRVRLQLLERRDQPGRVTRQRHAAHVG